MKGLATTDTERRRVYLRPGELYVGREPTLVTTVLGSCVSATIFGRRLRAGAICHAVLPASDSYEPDPEAFRFVDRSVQHLLDQMGRLGLSREELEVKAFGGAEGLASGGVRFGVGRRNVTALQRLLDRLGIPIAASDLGGTRGRKLVFYTDTGEVYLKRLQHAHLNDRS